MRFESFYLNLAFTRENNPIAYANREESDQSVQFCRLIRLIPVCMSSIWAITILLLNRKDSGQVSDM